MKKNLPASKQLVLFCDSRLERRLRRKSVANQIVKPDSAPTAKRGAKRGKEIPRFVRCENISSSDGEESGLHGNGFGFGRSENDVKDDVQDLQGKTFLESPTETENSRALVCFPANDAPETPRILPIRSVKPAANRGKRLKKELSDLEKLNASKIGADYSRSERTLRSHARSEKKESSETLVDVPVKRRRTVSSAKKKKASQGDCYVDLVALDDDEDGEDLTRLINSFVPKEDEEGEEMYISFLNLGCVVLRSESDGSAERLSEANPGANGGKRFEFESEETGDVDSECRDYMNYLGIENEDPICKLDDVERNDSDPDLVVIERDPFGCEDFEPIDLEGDSLAADFGSASHRFKEELFEILKQPYDKKQHKKYLRDVQCRTPVLEDRNLRGGIKRFPSETRMGKSYLDHHADFAELIYQARDDRPKSLNLLRGFFFWLEKVSHSGMSKPWKDPSVLEVLPQKNSVN